MYQRARLRILTGALAIALAASLTACADPTGQSGTGAGTTITIGSQGTAESEIIARLYGGVLEDNGYIVEYNDGVGGRGTFIPALQTGLVDVMPDTSGALLYGADTAAYARTPVDVTEALPKALSPLKLHVLRPSEAQIADAFVVTEQYSTDHQVTSIGDLAYYSSSITIGATADFETRRYGRAGLLSVYDVSGFTFKAINDAGGAETVSELLTDAVQVAGIPSTSPSISRNNLVVLADPKNLITAQNVVPVIGKKANTADIARLLNGVSAALTTADLRELNEKATATAIPATDRIATAWLSHEGLIH